MTRTAFLIPGDITLPTGGYAYDRRVLALLARHGVSAEHVALPGSYPAPTDSDLTATRTIIDRLAPETVLLVDGLAYGAMPDALVRGFGRPIVALCHHPLALEAGLTAERSAALKVSEMAALRQARHVIVTSRTTADTLVDDFGVARDAITVAEPGTDKAKRARGTGQPLQLLAVGSIVPRKGYGVLARALRRLPEGVDWKLTIVGAVRDGAARASLDAELSGPVAGRVSVLGGVDDAQLAALYDRADIFVMSSLYEGFGMVLTEAMARGLPIVCTTGGAAASTAPDAAALKVVPGDEAALGAALIRVCEDRELRRRMADAAWDAAQSLATWDDTARIVADVLKRVKA
jgi:glycosyltransferase involved in cell wall biosynthesis